MVHPPKRALADQEQDEGERPKRLNSRDLKTRVRRLSSEEEEYTTDETSDEEDSEVVRPTSRKSSKAPRRWQPIEDRKLAESVKQHGEANWKAIASKVGSRNHVQCLQRWKKVLRPGLVKGQWSAQEDAVLMKLASSGFKNWGVLSNHMPGRTSKQCRERWCHHLDPSINKGAYTELEDKIILSAQAKLGNRWSQIAAQLPGRTENSIKIRCKALQRRASGEPNSSNSSSRTSAARRTSSSRGSDRSRASSSASSGSCSSEKASSSPGVTCTPLPDREDGRSRGLDRACFNQNTVNTKSKLEGNASFRITAGHANQTLPPASPPLHQRFAATSLSADCSVPEACVPPSVSLSAPASLPASSPTVQPPMSGWPRKPWCNSYTSGIVSHPGSGAAPPTMLDNNHGFLAGANTHMAYNDRATHAIMPGDGMSPYTYPSGEVFPSVLACNAIQATAPLSPCVIQGAASATTTLCGSMYDQGVASLVGTGGDSAVDDCGLATLLGTSDSRADQRDDNVTETSQLDTLSTLDVKDLEATIGHQDGDAAAPLRSCCSFLDLPGEGLVVGDIPLQW